MTECLMVLVDYINVDRTYQFGYALTQDQRVSGLVARLKTFYDTNKSVFDAVRCYDGLVARVMSASTRS
jgi:hypothetical protein